MKVTRLGRLIRVAEVGEMDVVEIATAGVGAKETELYSLDTLHIVL